MLLFSTVLDVKRELDASAFRKLVVEWNERFRGLSKDGENDRYKENYIPGFVWERERSLKCGTENLWIAVEEYVEKNIIAVRYEKKSAEGIIWDTDYVMDFKERKLAIRLERSYTEDANLNDHKFSPPFFITILIEHDLFPMDGDLPISNQPVYIRDENVGLLAGVVKGENQYRLPIVFVSKNTFGKDPVDVKRLASRLKGMAHVLVQEDRGTNEKIREACEGRNEYNGTIGVYFPNPMIKKGRYFTSNPSEDVDAQLLEKVISRVLQFCNSKVVDPIYTWQGVNHALLFRDLSVQRERSQLAEEARKKAEDEVAKIIASLDDEHKRITEEAVRKATDEANRLIEEFDEENRKYKEKIAALSKENERLRYENDGLNAKINRFDSVPVLVFGNEKDLYPGEIKDMLLTTIEESLIRFRDDSRRMHILKDLLEHNNFKHEAKEREAMIQKVMTGYRKMDGATRQILEEMGFVISSDGAHYKLVYCGDPRYATTLPKTGSDGAHGGKNAASIVTNMLC